MKNILKWDGKQFVTGHISRTGRFVDVRPVSEVRVERTSSGVDVKIIPAKGVRIVEYPWRGINRVALAAISWTEVERDGWIRADSVTIELDGEEIKLDLNRWNQPRLRQTTEEAARVKASSDSWKKDQAALAAAFPGALKVLFEGKGLTRTECRRFRRWVRRWVEFGKAQDQVQAFISDKIGSEFKAWSRDHRTVWESTKRLRAHLAELIAE